MIEIKVSGLTEMRNFFRPGGELDREIEQRKAAMVEQFDRFTNDVRDINVPVGPPHRPDVSEGTLRASVMATVTNTPDELTMRLSVGGGTDYNFYEAARDGVEYFRGADAVEERMLKAMNGENDDV